MPEPHHAGNPTTPPTAEPHQDQARTTHRTRIKHRLMRLLHTIRSTAAAEAAQLLGLPALTDQLRTVIAHQEVLMSTADDLRRAVFANTAADNRLITDFEQLREQLANLPTDRPLNADEQAAIDDAVSQLEARTAAILAVDPDPGTPVPNGDGTGTQGGVVDVNATGPAVMTGPQGGVVDLADDNPTPTQGTPGDAQFVDPSASSPVATADQPPTGDAENATTAEVTEPGPDSDHPVLEPAPPAQHPVFESPAEDAGTATPAPGEQG